MREYKSLADPGERLTELLNRDMIDDYQRKNKNSRDDPRKKQEPAAGPPMIRKASCAEIQLAQEVKEQQKKS